MAKIVAAFIKEKVTANGEKFYTAHVQFKGHVLWFIPYYFIHNIVLIDILPDAYALHSNGSYFVAHQFSDKEYAEAILMEEIDKKLDEQAKIKERKVVKETKEYVNLFPVNDPGSALVDLDT